MKGLLFTYALTALGGLGGLVSPFFGLCVYIAFSILRPEHMWPWSVPVGNYSRIVGICMLAGWAFSGFGSWRIRGARLIIGCFVAYWVWLLLSTFYALDYDRAWDLFVFYAKVVLPVLVGITTIDSIRKVRILAWVILCSMGYLAFEMNMHYFSGYNVAWRKGFGGLDNNCLAIAMVTGVGLAFFLGLGADRLWKQGVALVCAALMTHTIMFSFSRGGMLALVITGMVAFFLIPKTPKHWLLLLVAVAVGIRMAGPEVQERFMTAFSKNEETGFEASAQSRLDLWRAAWSVTMRNPLLGIGGDNFGHIADEFGFEPGKQVHSLWVQNLCELGFPGLFLLMGYFGFCMLRLWPIARGRGEVTDPWIRDAARMVVSSLVGFVVAAQFVTIKYLEVPFYICMLGAAVLVINQPKQEPYRPPMRATPAVRVRTRPASQPVLP